MNAEEERRKRAYMIWQGHEEWCMALPRAGITAPCNCALRLREQPRKGILSRLAWWRT